MNKLLLIIPYLITFQLASARQRIHGIGSPITFFHVAKITEKLKYSKGLPTPFIEIGMTGFAFQFFCTGIDDNYPDFVNSSREMSSKEIEICRKNNVEFDRIILTYDSLVLVTKEDNYLTNISQVDFFNAISGYVFNKDGYLAANRNKTWRDVNPSLPAKKIIFYGTTLTSGTYDFLKDKIFHPQCKKAKADDPLRHKCGLARMDGRYIPVPGGYTMNIQKMNIRKNSVAMVPYIFYKSYNHNVHAIKLNNSLPSETNNKSYLLSRPLYVYIKKNSLTTIPHFTTLVAAMKEEAPPQ